MQPAVPFRPDRRLPIALAVAFLWHGGLLLSGSYRRTYDAYIHMFFGDHYARDWFSTWETRWYTGFTTTSYPPGTHQLIGLLSGTFGLEGSFIIVQLFSILFLVLGVYRFSLIWVDEKAAGWAALLAVVSTSLAEVVHVFGQLPTTFSLAVLLNTLPSIFHWVRDARWRHLIMATLGLAATTAGHHVTTLFGTVFFVGPVIATALLDRLRTPHTEERPGHARFLGRSTFFPAIARRVRRILPATIRAGVVGCAAVCVLVIVVLPYWLWSSSDPIVQIPIPHASRDNFLANRPAGLVFFLVPWGVTLAALPIALIRGAFSRALPLASSVGLLFLLGTGGTTPIPRMLLGGAFDILTLDRFTIWASIAVLPLMGWLASSLTSGVAHSAVTALFGERIWKFALASTACALLLAAVGTANFTRFRPLQPDRIDPDPIAAFMEKDQHDRWRYLSLGFGDQMAIVSASTTATTVDGNYHSARRLPELTSRSVERLEGAKFRGIPGIGSLQQFLATPERYNLKFVFSNDVFYDPLLWASGWHRLDRLQNDVVVWERADIPPLPDVLPTRELPDWQRLMWGTLPMTAIVLASLGFAWTLRGQPISRRINDLGSTTTRIGMLTPPAKIYGRIDTWLARTASRAPVQTSNRRWYTDLDERAKRILTRVATSKSARKFARRGCAVLAVLALLSVWQQRPAPTAATPESTIESYYDDLDFQRFNRAWSRLDPAERPSFDQYILERSVVDGLVSSYSKLDRIETELIYQGTDRARVGVSLVYITSLAEYRVSKVHELRLRDNAWKLVAPPSDVSTTPDQFSRATGVDYLSQGRRQVTTEQTLFGDVLDRPRIQTLSATAIEADGRFAVVGEITNLDVDPADLTVTARFLDSSGETLVEHNASIVAMHKVLPRETVPFRIDLESIAGSDETTEDASGNFHPDLFASPTIDVSQIDTVELITKAVVTGRDLDRPLQLQNLSIAKGPAGELYLNGEVRNDGTVTATVPHVLVTLLHEDGTVGWVDHIWVEEAIRPQRSVDFQVAITDKSALTSINTPLRIFGNGITTGEGAPFTANAEIPLPIGSGFDAIRVNVHSFFRAPPS